MRYGKLWGYLLSGAAAGAVAGIFGAGGGLVLVPLLTLCTQIPEGEVFASSLCVMLPVCVVCLYVTTRIHPIGWEMALPYLLGSAAGGILAGLWGHRVPVMWLHRILGILILWGGWRYLW